ncbi:hypothetical protein [Lampropedia aestuarii]|uniref:hypothetical protein n=1 Tax=Lampropedia aestuarii TaxID=2562762 RepID=UPI0024699FA0|nr:hypothetical protein [Lampropedia aestuarii]MDH5858556.1 hypothetical protein [Lampropedia aestuarii]
MSKGNLQVREGISDIHRGAGTLATTVPGTSVTGQVPTSISDLAGGAVFDIISGDGS